MDSLQEQLEEGIECHAAISIQIGKLSNGPLNAVAHFTADTFSINIFDLFDRYSCQFPLLAGMEFIVMQSNFAPSIAIEFESTTSQVLKRL